MTLKEWQAKVAEGLPMAYLIGDDGDLVNDILKDWEERERLFTAIWKMVKEEIEASLISNKR